MRARRLLICCLTGMLAAAAAPSVALAGFSVGPTVIDLHVAPGAARTGTFTVALDGERGRFQVLVQDIVQAPNGAFGYRTGKGGAYSASQWIMVFPHEFRGAPDRSQAVEYRVRVPRDAEPGDHVTSLTVRRMPEAGGDGSVPLQAVSVRLTVRVPGQIVQRVELGKPHVPGLAGRGPIDADVAVHNTGNVRLDFRSENRGELAILAGDTAKARLPFGGILLPGETRSFRVSLQDPPAIGRLEARATLATPQGRITRSAGVWMIPWRQAGALLLLALAALVVVGGRRRGRRRIATPARG